MSLNLTSDGMTMEELVDSSEIRVPFQAWSVNSTMSVSVQPEPSAQPDGLQLSIDPDKLAQAEFDMAAKRFGDRNREALTELAKW